MGTGVFVQYQRTRKVHRIAITMPAATLDWIDTCLHPCIIGTRPVACWWEAKVAHDPQEETLAAFKTRLGDIRLRFVSDESVTVNRRCYVYLGDPLTDTPISKPDAEVTLNNRGGTRLRFPMDAGRIQVRLAGVNPTDVGSVRIVFVILVAASDDYVAFDDSVDRFEMFDFDTEEFPGLPSLPEPQLGP